MNVPDLDRRQQQLLLRSARLRQDLSASLNTWRPPLAGIDRLRAGLQWLKEHPIWPLSAVAVVALLRPRRAITWASRLWWAWSTFKRVRRQLGGP